MSSTTRLTVVVYLPSLVDLLLYSISLSTRAGLTEVEKLLSVDTRLVRLMASQYSRYQATSFLTVNSSQLGRMRMLLETLLMQSVLLFHSTQQVLSRERLSTRKLLWLDMRIPLFSILTTSVELELQTSGSSAELESQPRVVNEKATRKCGLSFYTMKPGLSWICLGLRI